MCGTPALPRQWALPNQRKVREGIDQHDPLAPREQQKSVTDDRKTLRKNPRIDRHRLDELETGEGINTNEGLTVESRAHIQPSIVKLEALRKVAAVKAQPGDHGVAVLLDLYSIALWCA